MDGSQHQVRRRRLYLGALQIAVSVGLIAVALTSFQWGILAATVNRLSFLACAIGAFFAVLSTILTAIRWHMLAQPVAPGLLMWHVSHYFRSTLLNNVTPANLGADAYRLVVLRRIAGTGPVALLLLRERYIGLLSYCVTFLAGLLVIASTDLALLQRNALILLPIAVVAVAVVAVAATAPLVLRWLCQVSFRGHWRHISSAAKLGLEIVRSGGLSQFCQLLAISLLAALSWIVSVIVIAGGMDISLPLSIAAVVGVAVELARWVPISVQGIGVRESLYAWLLASLAGIPKESGFVIGAAAYIILSISTIAIGIIFATLSGIRKARD